MDRVDDRLHVLRRGGRGDAVSQVEDIGAASPGFQKPFHLGVKPGAEMLKAVERAEREGAKVVLGARRKDKLKQIAE